MVLLLYVGFAYSAFDGLNLTFLIRNVHSGIGTETKLWQL